MHIMFNKLSAALSSFCAESIARGVFVALLAFTSPAMAQDAPAAPPKEAPSGQIAIEQIQVAFIGSGAVGGGTLTFEGKEYKFKVAGLGVGGFGASRLSAKGEVYGLKKLADFAGAYGEVRMGWAATR